MNTDQLALIRKSGYVPYGPSARRRNKTLYVMARQAGVDWLIIAGQDDPLFSGMVSGEMKVCGLTAENCAALRRTFPYTAPVDLGDRPVTLGLGDRLDICTGAHIRALAGTEVFPVLGQQSKRELMLTGRTNRQMMDAVAWQVFRAGYEGGYAVDGDHLKTLEEVLEAIRDGVTVITLDCSEHIDNTACAMSAEAAENACRSVFQADVLALWERLYCERVFPVGNGMQVAFERDLFWQMLLTYGNALFFVKEIYEKAIAPSEHPITFELSIDETQTDTALYAHYFIAAELRRMGVAVNSVAPRFCGQFQKGIDYIGDVGQFERQLQVHAAIARRFGYRVSIHSGSDKFSIFPCVGKSSGGRFHLKTSGTSWVESVRVIAACEPSLFRRMAAYALQCFDEARKYYHVSAETARAPDVALTDDKQLPDLMDQPDLRQIMHITYGFLLQSKENGAYRFRSDIYRVLQQNHEYHDEVICRHIRRHLELLGVTERRA